MVPRFIVGWLVTLTAICALPAWALEYRLQVANIPFLTLSSYETRAGDLSALESRLDTMEFPAGAVIPDREVTLLQDPKYGGKVPARLSVLPTTREQAWTTLVWDANPGDTLVFEIKSYMSAWQEAYMLAANPEGRLRRMALGNPSFFGGLSYEIPTVSYDFLANAVDQGSFTSWMARTAKTINGMTLAIGQGRDPHNTVDRLYIALTMPSAPRAFKVVIGWKNRRDDHGNGKRNDLRSFRQCETSCTGTKEIMTKEIMTYEDAASLAPVFHGSPSGQKQTLMAERERHAWARMDTFRHLGDSDLSPGSHRGGAGAAESLVGTPLLRNG
jgi:hypothetical protein